MSIRDRFIYKTAVGFSLGILIVIVIETIACFAYTGNAGSYFSEFQGAAGGRPFVKLMLELLTGGLLGVVGNGGAVVYEIEEWSILKSTTIHFCVTMCVYMAVGKANGWLTWRPSVVNAIQIILMVLIYFLIWLVQYLIYKREVAELNREIKDFKMRKAID